ncbi:MAG: hypothetical protein GY869_18590, partial [Planctomycetes bacterium]|nr:hypothetical protein [Planctomycetota bacterium]
TIQAGIDAAVDTDTVLVQPGTYIENINYNGKNIVLGSLFLTTQDTSYITQTVIDGNEGGSVVRFESGEDSTAILNGFTITRGEGGGIYCTNSNPTLTNNIITDNHACYGGGIRFENSNSILTNNKIENNVAHWPSGDHQAEGYGGGIFAFESDLTLMDNTIMNNSTRDDGGGIFASDSDLTLMDNTIMY